MTIFVDTDRLNQVVEAGSLFLHTPAESASAYVQYVEELLNSPAIDYGSTFLDSHITPMRPGEVTTVVARPGNGKTSFLIYMARRHAQEINTNNNGTSGKCVIYVTWEETIESIEMSIQSGKDYTAEQVAWGKVDLELVKTKSVKRANLPIFIIGKSLIRDRKKRKPPMTINKVRDTIMALYYEFKIEPSLICFDYLQKIPVPNGKNRMDEVTEAMFMTSELAMDVNCPILMGAQATRDVDDQGLPIPTLSGAQWSSAIEQESFRMFGLLRPVTVAAKNGESLDEVKVNGRLYPVNKNLLLLRLLKQRKYFPPLSIFPVHFKPDVFELSDYEITRMD
jgi:replicative DNA helicase